MRFLVLSAFVLATLTACAAGTPVPDAASTATPRTGPLRVAFLLPLGATLPEAGQQELRGCELRKEDSSARMHFKCARPRPHVERTTLEFSEFSRELLWLSVYFADSGVDAARAGAEIVRNFGPPTVDPQVFTTGLPLGPSFKLCRGSSARCVVQGWADGPTQALLIYQLRNDEPLRPFDPARDVPVALHGRDAQRIADHVRTMERTAKERGMSMVYGPRLPSPWPEYEPVVPASGAAQPQ